MLLEYFAVHGTFPDSAERWHAFVCKRKKEQDEDED